MFELTDCLVLVTLLIEVSVESWMKMVPRPLVNDGEL